jgi:hypothetical protein
MPVIAASAEQLAAMRRNAAEFQAYALGPVANAVLGRYAFYEAICKTHPHVLPPALQADNATADVAAVRFAQAGQGLDSGKLELAHHTESEQGGELTLGIVVAGSVPSSLELWPLVGVIVVGAALVGTWLLVDAWLSVRALESQSDALRAKTAAAVTDAIARANPADAQAIASALERANNAANNVQPGLLDRLASAAGDVTTAVRDSSWLLLALGGYWLWSRRRRAA